MWVLLSVIALHVLSLDVPLDLILTEPKWKIQLKGLVILPRLGLLEACLIGISSCSRAALGSATGILRTMIIRGTIGSGRCC